MSWIMLRVCILLACGITLSVATRIGWHNAKMQRMHHTFQSYVTLAAFLFFQFMAYGHAVKELYGLFRR